MFYATLFRQQWEHVRELSFFITLRVHDCGRISFASCIPAGPRIRQLDSIARKGKLCSTR